MDIFKPRLISLKEKIEQKNYRLFAVQKKENIYYLTGFWGDQGASILLVSSNKCYLLVHFIYYLEAKESINNTDIEIVGFQTDKFKHFLKLADSFDKPSLVLEESSLSYQDYKKIKDIMQQKKIKVEVVSGLLEKQRIIKDKTEINNLKKACQVSDKVYEYLIASKKDFFYGLTETRLGLEMEEKIYELGADGASFDFIIANNQSSAFPHYHARNKMIRPGALLLDYGAAYGHYHADITRTFFIDLKKEDKFKKIYDIVLQAQILALENCRPGIKCNQLDQIARNFIKSKGYGECFGHGLGHGAGLEVHEAPVIGKSSSQKLKPGMVVTIEPGIYLEGLGGVRIEDTVLVEEGGCQPLINCTKTYTNLIG
ncbi:MAG: Xaa-Pro peptidase family protein [Actinomycetia bacterium]|nr:Xaa-Pro peptidase family protein [Actinomycetes bacterium]